MPQTALKTPAIAIELVNDYLINENPSLTGSLRGRKDEAFATEVLTCMGKRAEVEKVPGM